MNIKRTIEQY